MEAEGSLPHSQVPATCPILSTTVYIILLKTDDYVVAVFVLISYKNHKSIFWVCHFCPGISSSQPSGLQYVITARQLCSQKHNVVLVLRVTVAI